MIRNERPWGSWEILFESKNYKVKKIMVNPKSRLSLQKHIHRDEIWVIVECEKGIVSIDEEQKEILVGDNIKIKRGKPHRIENASDKTTLVFIETQIGDYLGEDDIERIEDDYNRKG